MYYLGVDAGTSKIKAAMIDQSGRQIDIESRRVDTLHPFHGASEMDMEGLWHAFCDITNSLKRRNEGICF